MVPPRGFRIAGSAVALFLALCTTAMASSSPSLSVAERVRRSDRVVRAVVEGQRTVSDPRDARRVFTLSRVRVREHLKGHGVGFVEVVQLGGRHEGWTSEVPGDAQLEASAELVLFLRCGVRLPFALEAAGSVPRCALVGLGDGALQVRGIERGEPYVRVRDTAGRLETLSLQTVRQRIRAAATASGGSGPLSSPAPQSGNEVSK